jgi:DNA-directed RNA polymerase beta' subunit
LFQYENNKCYSLNRKLKCPKYQHIITGLKTDILRSKVLEAISVGKVTNSNEEGPGSINDPKGGTLNDNENCRTCGEINIGCVGHLQYIQLPKDVEFVPAVYLETVVRILRCVCRYCAGLLVTEVYMRQTNLLDYRGGERLQKLADQCVDQKIRCQRYSGGNMPGKFSPLKNATEKDTARCLQNTTYKLTPQFIQCVEQASKQKGRSSHRGMHERGDDTSELKMSVLKGILSEISGEDKVLMGFTADTVLVDFVTDKLPVIPLNARPPVYRDGEVKVDHFTWASREIMKEIGKYKPSSDENTKLGIIADILYKYYNHMVDNSDESLRNGNDPVVSVKERITGKGQTIRGSCMGKRVSYCSRTVLNPDSNLRFGEVGVPESTRAVLTVPEVVTKHNIDDLQEMYKEGKIKTIKFGSDTRSKKLEGRSMRAAKTKEYITDLAIGDTVTRYGKDGDVCLIGRQPTLHKEGLQAYKRSYGPTKTIRLHMCACGPHNADFDGDEGTEHALQTIGARSEGRHIANAESCIMDSQKSKTMVGLTYNALTSLFMLTQMGEDEVILDKEEIRRIVDTLTYREDLDTIDKRLEEQKINPLCGRALFSYILPAGFCYKANSITRTRKIKLPNGEIREEPVTAKVEIRDGILLSGPITKKHVGAVHNSIIHYLWNNYGKVRTAAFLTDGTFLSDQFIFNHGFSVGYGDCIVPDPQVVREVVENELEKAQLSIDALGPELPSMSKSEKEYREQQCRGFTDNASNIGKLIGQQSLTEDNGLNIMANSGAKGNEINTAGITGSLGQQYIRRNRPIPTIDNDRRCLPYFAPNSIKLEARGMCKESFMIGLRPAGTFFHMCASRIGLVGTSVMTAITGAVHHRVAKALESVAVAYDGSLRNCTGACFQLVWSDGFEAGHMIPTNIEGMGALYNFIDIKNTVANLNFALEKRFTELEELGELPVSLSDDKDIAKAVIKDVMKKRSTKK